jgi:hypothetical protein
MDASFFRPHNGLMAVTPAPDHGGVVLGRDRPGRALRVSSHPELGRVVLSLWDGARCIGTLRVAPDDVPDMVRALTGAAVAAATHLDPPPPTVDLVKPVPDASPPRLVVVPPLD